MHRLLDNAQNDGGHKAESDRRRHAGKKYAHQTSPLAVRGWGVAVTRPFDPRFPPP